MGTARFLDKPDDLRKLGLISGVVQQREDGRVSPVGRAGSEVFYFDATLDDGTKVTAGFRTKPIQNCQSVTDDPIMVISITTGDGKVYSDTARYQPEESLFDLEKCNIKVGPHSVVGDLENYHIIVKPIARKAVNTEATDAMKPTSVKGVGVDLHFTTQVKPFRHGAGRTVFNNDEDLYSSWFCIPKFMVTGTIILEGIEQQVSGTGYHDHRCMAIDDILAWHHWIWGRQYFEDYTVVIFDLVTAELYGYERVPLFCIYDKNGEIIFDNGGDYTCEVIEESYNAATNRHYPKIVEYKFATCGKKVTYRLDWIEEMEARDMYSMFPEQLKTLYDAAKQQPTYMRYYSKGELIISENGNVITRDGTLIYELAYCGRENSTVFENPSKKTSQ